MKNALRILSFVLLLLAGLFFVFASAKFVEAEDQEDELIIIEEATEDSPPIVTRRKSADEQFASLGFNTALICGIGGVLLFFVSRGIKSTPDD